MRIVQVAPLVSPIDETREPIGGAQVLLAELARGLAARGHEVTLAAADGSRLSGMRVAPLAIHSAALRPAPMAQTSGERGDEAQQAEAFGRVRGWIEDHRAEIDVVHAHAYDAPAFDALAGAPRPVVHTLHLPPLDDAVVRAARRASDATMVTVSDANARAWRSQSVPVPYVVHNGIDLDRIPLGVARGTHLVCAGRISPEKGVHVAIAVARRVGRPLVILGGVYDASYFATAVAPRVRELPNWRPGDPVSGAVYIGRRSRSELHGIVASSAVTLMPVLWDEPFGLVALESLAAGTPVVAYRRGGLAEILDATSGELVAPGDETGLERAIGRAAMWPPDACRARAARFSLGAMLSGYEAVYAAVQSGAPRRDAGYP